MGGVGAHVILLFQNAQRARRVALHHGLEEVDDAGAVGHAQHVAQAERRDGAAARAMGDGLIEDRERVAHRTLRRAGDQGQRVALDVHLLLGANARQMVDQHLRLDAAQVEALAARAHGHRHLLDFGGGEEEFHMFGRLLQRLQQGVEGVLGEHVHFVDDVDLGARHHRAEARVLDDLAHIVDARVGGGVHLDHINVTALDDRLAMGAKLGHVDGGPCDGGVAVTGGQFVVEGARQNAGGGGLAHPAHAGQQIGLMDAVEVEGVREGPDHGLLADQILEAGRAIFAREHPVSGGRLDCRGRGHAEVEAQRGLFDSTTGGGLVLSLIGHVAPFQGRPRKGTRRERWEAGQRPARSR